MFRRARLGMTRRFSLREWTQRCPTTLEEYMNRRRLPIVAATLFGGAMLAAACSGASATQTPGHTVSAPTVAAPTVPAAGGSPSVESPSATLAAPTAPSGAGTSPAATEPGAGGSFALPSFASDSELAAKFPTTIDGQPVSNVQTYLFVDILKFAGQTDAQLQQLRQSLQSFGIDLDKLSAGSGDATVDGSDVQLSALRAPGSNATDIVTHYVDIQAAVTAATGQPAPSQAPPTFTPATIGGKNVSVATDADGNKTYLYPSGDTLWSIDNVTDAQAAKIIAALP